MAEVKDFFKEAICSITEYLLNRTTIYQTKSTIHKKEVSIPGVQQDFQQTEV